MERLLTAEHTAGTAPTAGEKITPTSARKSLIMRVRVKCTDATNNLGISFDKGKNYYPVASNGGEFAEDCRAHEIWLRGEGGTATYSLVMFTG